MTGRCRRPECGYAAAARGRWPGWRSGSRRPRGPASPCPEPPPGARCADRRRARRRSPAAARCGSAARWPARSRDPCVLPSFSTSTCIATIPASMHAEHGIQARPRISTVEQRMVGQRPDERDGASRRTSRAGSTAPHAAARHGREIDPVAERRAGRARECWPARWRGGRPGGGRRGARLSAGARPSVAGRRVAGAAAGAPSGPAAGEASAVRSALWRTRLAFVVGGGRLRLRCGVRPG